MLFLVTSYTREPVSFTDAKHVSPSVLAVVVNKARRPSDYLLVPYEQVLKINRRHGIQLTETPKGVLVYTADKKRWRAPFETEAQAHIAYWVAQQSGATDAPKKQATPDKPKNQMKTKRPATPSAQASA
jgi:hypothetical protein